DDDQVEAGEDGDRLAPVAARGVGVFGDVRPGGGDVLFGDGAVEPELAALDVAGVGLEGAEAEGGGDGGGVAHPAVGEEAAAVPAAVVEEEEAEAGEVARVGVEVGGADRLAEGVA